METEPKKEFFYQLESLRGIAALLVIGFHCCEYLSPLKTIMLFYKGYVMVDLFFVLSGFVIFNNYSTAIYNINNFKNFIILRLGRIYPLHVLTTLIWLTAPLVEYITGNYGINKSSISLTN